MKYPEGSYDNDCLMVKMIISKIEKRILR